MIICTLRNDKGEYVSMRGGKTTDWFQASKFPEEDAKQRLRYADEEFDLIRFDMWEISESELKLNQEACEQILKLYEDTSESTPYFKGYKPQQYFNIK